MKMYAFFDLLIRLKLLLLFIFMGYYLCAKNCVNHFSVLILFIFQSHWIRIFHMKHRKRGRYIVTSPQILFDETSAAGLKFNSALAPVFITCHNSNNLIDVKTFCLCKFVFHFDLYNSSSPGRLFPFYKDDWEQIMGAHFSRNETSLRNKNFAAGIQIHLQ